jgi:hypothetical protein
MSKGWRVQGVSTYLMQRIDGDTLEDILDVAIQAMVAEGVR